MHDYKYRYAQFTNSRGSSVTIDMHRIMAVNGAVVMMDNRVEIELGASDGLIIQGILLDMDRNFNEAD